MSAKKRTSVVWFPPEQNPQYPVGAWREVTRAVVEEPYLEVVGFEDDELVTEQRTREREVDVPGRLMVLVDLAPHHGRCGVHRFEPFEGDPAEYRQRRAAQPGEKGYLTPEQAQAAYAEQAAENRSERARVREELEAELARVEPGETLTVEPVEGEPVEVDRAQHLRELIEDFS